MKLGGKGGREGTEGEGRAKLIICFKNIKIKFKMLKDQKKKVRGTATIRKNLRPVRTREKQSRGCGFPQGKSSLLSTLCLPVPTFYASYVLPPPLLGLLCVPPFILAPWLSPDSISWRTASLKLKLPVKLVFGSVCLCVCVCHPKLTISVRATGTCGPFSVVIALLLSSVPRKDTSSCVG